MRYEQNEVTRVQHDELRLIRLTDAIASEAGLRFCPSSKLSYGFDIFKGDISIKSLELLEDVKNYIEGYRDGLVYAESNALRTGSK